jgi:predicted phosphate transport protein (TIGR00153 family)
MAFFKKEKEVRKLILEHLSLTQDCLAEVRAVLEHYMAGELDVATEKAEMVKRLERECDYCKRKAREVLHDGAFLPQVRADIHHLIELADTINGAGEAAAKCLVNEQPTIPPEFETDLMEICTQCLNSFHELRKAIKIFVDPDGEMPALHEHVERVYKLESEIHIKQAELTRKIFSSGLELAQKIHLGQLLRDICSISDQSEDVADALESTVMRSVV